jgi:C4-type Zn-finger protein
MTCPKCITGLLIIERNYDAHEGQGYITMTKCLNCGWYDDDTMRANRLATGSSFPTFQAREMTRYEEVLK